VVHRVAAEVRKLSQIVFGRFLLSYQGSQPVRGIGNLYCFVRWCVLQIDMTTGRERRLKERASQIVAMVVVMIQCEK